MTLHAITHKLAPPLLGEKPAGWPYLSLSLPCSEVTPSFNHPETTVTACREIWEWYLQDSIADESNATDPALFVLGLMRLGQSLPSVSTNAQWQARFQHKRQYLLQALALYHKAPLQNDWLCSPAERAIDPVVLGKQLIKRALQQCLPHLANLISATHAENMPINPERLLTHLRDIAHVSKQ